MCATGFTDELYITSLVYLKKKSQTTDFINVYSLLFKFSDFNQSKVSTEIFPDAVLAEILPVATSPRIPKSRNHESQDTSWEDLNFEPNGQSRSIGWGGSFSHSKHFFLKFTYTKLNYHEVSPSPLFWNHVKYWSENKGVYNFNSEIETQAHKSSSYKILMWKFMCSNIACEHDNFWHVRMLALYIS